MTIPPKPEGGHVVAIPYPAQGHINGMLQLCYRLLPLGFSFTFVNTHHIHSRLQGAPSVGLDNHGVEVGSTIDMAFVEGGFPPEDHARTSTIKRVFAAAQDMKESVEQLIAKVMEERKVAFILTDFFLGWSSEMATKFCLPWVCFCPVSAASIAALSHFADLAEQGKRLTLPDDKEEASLVLVEDIPGLPITCLGDLPKVWDDAGNVKYEGMKMFHDARKALVILFNTFEELEGEVLQSLSERQYPTLAVGPLLPSFYLSGASPVDRVVGQDESRASLFKEDRTCLEWLDKQAAASVLFISFGSISLRSDEQLAELAYAVEASGCPYLWVRKPDISDGEPPAVEAQHPDHGLIVSWAPQLDVLSHPAVGGFLTHCGWNSVIESVAKGVPMLCWADTGERMSNQRFVVQIWKCGLDIVPDVGRRYKQHVDDAALVTRKEIEKSVRCLIIEETGSSVRARAARLRDDAVVAFQNSRSKFNRFANILREQNLDRTLL